ncbi:MAG: hypothetical protein ACPL7B_14565, partial [Candidatus Poribacteria bacterium]
MIKALLFGMPDIVPRYKVLLSVPSLGLASLAGNIDHTICNIKIADLSAIRHKWRDFIGSILKEQSP